MFLKYMDKDIEKIKQKLLSNATTYNRDYLSVLWSETMQEKLFRKNTFIKTYLKNIIVIGYILLLYLFNRVYKNDLANNILSVVIISHALISLFFFWILIKTSLYMESISKKNAVIFYSNVIKPPKLQTDLLLFVMLLAALFSLKWFVTIFFVIFSTIFTNILRKKWQELLEYWVTKDFT